MMKKSVITIVIVLLGSACATSYQASYSYNEILVVNNSSELVQDVTIEVVDTGRMFSCGNIAPRGICSNRFGKRRYERNPIQISWSIGDASSKTESFVVEVPATFYPGIALRGVLKIAPDGSVSAYFEQDTPQN